MASPRKRDIVALLWLLASASTAESNYLPGFDLRDYRKGERMNLMVTKSTSSKRLIPLEYYRLPFCQPTEVQHANENLAMFLSGDRIESSMYRINMLEPLYCEHLCAAHMGKTEGVGGKPNTMIRSIRKQYHSNWIIDNLFAASKFGDKEFYRPGFPIGFVSAEDGRAFIHNHVNLNITYHKLQGKDEADDKYRVVRFLVEPLSIRHQYETSNDGGFTIKGSGVATCQENYNGKQHTDLAMINGNYQPASGEVLFTYDVIWVEDTKLRWTSQWDVSLSMNNAVPAKVHWLSIVTSLVTFLVLTAAIAVILLRDLHRVYRRYDGLAADEEKEGEDVDQERDEWLLFHENIFQPPGFSPLLLAVCCGIGAQLLCTSLLTVVVALNGLLSPAKRGSLLMSLLLLYTVTGGLAGYVTAWLYKAFKGKNRRLATCLTAFGFPGLAFPLFLPQMMKEVEIEFSIPTTVALLILWFGVLARMVRRKETFFAASGLPAIAITILLLLFEDDFFFLFDPELLVSVVLWLGILAATVFWGSYMGYKQDAMECPVDTSNKSSEPKTIRTRLTGRPDILWSVCLGGIVPFGASLLELHLVMSALWMNEYYHVLGFGYCFVVFFIVMVLCAQVSILVCWYYLNRRNYRWWWRSFWTSGSTAVWIFLYSLVFFRQQEVSLSLDTVVFYLGYMTVLCIGLLCMTGCMGVFSCLCFHKACVVCGDKTEELKKTVEPAANDGTPEIGN